MGPFVGGHSTYRTKKEEKGRCQKRENPDFKKKRDPIVVAVDAVVVDIAAFMYSTS